MLLQHSDLQTKHEQTMTKPAACNSNQPLGLQKESLSLFSQLNFFFSSQLCLGTIHRLII